MNERHTIIRFAATAILPVVATHGCLAPFWLMQAYAHSGGAWLPFMAVLFTGLVAPLYLAVLGCRLVQRRYSVSVSAGFAVLLSVLALDFFLDYALWGIGSGQFRTPDEGTVEVFRFMAVVAAPVFLMPPLIALSLRHVFFQSNRNA